MSYQILTTIAASTTDLKRNPIGTVTGGENGAVAILDHNELTEDVELNRIADERMKAPEFVSVNLDDL
ncbi:plasmid stabilization protein [Xenorhabdus sp. IM139775]|uniref:plasmid stabilization protein n=1 Tax=Xenorhabdus sp. IM139775 TaxID=3025876 RepID=UPI00235A3C11|nr:plasmid stabilization protein [Xenorhabdus sp. IM139775]MDC9594031.1 plasmid stabilization protein [Xenorhabdus sp. IM139775]